VGAAISALCFWLALRRVSLGDVWSSLAAAHWAWLVPTLVLTYATLFARAVRWRFLFHDPSALSTWEAAKNLNIGLMFNSILPSRAGEVPRLFGLARSTGLSKLEIAATIVVERVLDLLAVAVVALIAWPWLPDRHWINALCLLCAIIVAAIVAAGVAMWVLRRPAVALSTRFLRWAPFVHSGRAAERVEALVRGVRIVKEPRRLLVALALSAVVWAVTGLSILALYPAFDLSVTSSSVWLILVATSLATTVPSTSGGLGVYEAAVQSSLVAAGVATSPALSFALALHAVNLVPVSLTGALAAWNSATHHRREPRPAAAPSSR
jgi:P-type Mg2+ transporter